MSADPGEPDRRPGAPHPRETVVLEGQAEAEAGFLAASAGGRIHHAWLLTGPRGFGKATLAWRIARHLLAGATAPSLDMDPGDPVFRQVAALAAPRLFLCRRPWDDKARPPRLKTAITVDEVRALKGFFQLSAPDGGWRVAIVDAADELTDSAANALLKILEEPPPRSVLLLVCHQPARLMPTLRSRCRELRCRPLAAAPLARALAAAGVDPGGDADAVGALAAGSVGRAFDLVSAGGAGLYGEIVALLAAAPPLDRARAIALADSCSGRDAGARYALALELIGVALARLARAAAGAPVVPLSEREAAAFARLGRHPGQARIWAELAAELAGRTGHARAVHLDPAQVILDTLFRIDAAAAQAFGHAA